MIVTALHSYGLPGAFGDGAVDFGGFPHAPTDAANGLGGFLVAFESAANGIGTARETGTPRHLAGG
jgi:hypothetical protein